MMKFIKRLLIFIILLIIILYLGSRGHIYSKSELVYGVNFSKKQAEDFGLNWKEAYLAVLDELGVKKIRLAAYWNEIEPEQGKFVWEDLDWQINEASKRNIEIILAIGGRLPRWPECHFPVWADGLSAPNRKKAILN